MLGAASKTASFLNAPVPPNSSRWLLTMHDASHANRPVYWFHLPSGPWRRRSRCKLKAVFSCSSGSLQLRHLHCCPADWCSWGAGSGFCLHGSASRSDAHLLLRASVIDDHVSDHQDIVLAQRCEAAAQVRLAAIRGVEAADRANVLQNAVMLPLNRVKLWLLIHDACCPHVHFWYVLYM